ncbi:MAG: hypothetical protein HY909_11190 [Deltaproteobacteria bacterium]|nr:hypothetical protein [Deltaproteobacteria bacterium]
MEPEGASLVQVPLHGTFVGGELSTEAPSELEGAGSIEVLERGLALKATWKPRQRRLGALLGTLLVAPLGGLLTSALGSFWPGFGVSVVAGVWLAVWLGRGRPFDEVIAWTSVRRPSISQDMLTFEIVGPRKGRVCFRLPGHGLKELRPIARELQRRSA